jgi:translation initiation factor IF-3
MSRDSALQLAKDQGLDLVEISPTAVPPVVKIVNWGKYSYKRTKQLQKQKRLAKNPGLKQMRFGLKIGEHDLGVKLRKVVEFLEAGHKVKITLFYRGREIAHKDIGFTLADKVINQLNSQAVVEQPPQLLGKQLTFVLRSNPSAKAKDSQRNEEPDQDNEDR